VQLQTGHLRPKDQRRCSRRLKLNPVTYAKIHKLQRHCLTVGLPKGISYTSYSGLYDPSQHCMEDE